MIGAVILAAGSGKRMGTAVPKQYLTLKGKPLYMHSVDAFLPMVSTVVVVAQQERVAEVEKELSGSRYHGRVQVCAGGEERYDSAYAGLKCLQAIGDFEYVLVHDAARCNVKADVIFNVIKDMKAYGAAVAAVPEKNTVKQADLNGFVEKTLDRTTLWEIQTPQGFLTAHLMEGYEAFYQAPVSGITDDSSVLETYTSYPVKLTMGSYGNIKVTTPEDVALLTNGRI